MLADPLCLSWLQQNKSTETSHLLFHLKIEFLWQKYTGETLSVSQSYLMSICEYFLEIFKGYFLSEYYKEIMLWTINLICFTVLAFTGPGSMYCFC